MHSSFSLSFPLANFCLIFKRRNLFLMHYALLDKLSQLAPPTIKEAIKDDDAYPLIFLSRDVFDVFFYFLLPYETYIR